MNTAVQHSFSEDKNEGLLRYLNLDIPLHNVYDFIELSRNGINTGLNSLLWISKCQK